MRDGLAPGSGRRQMRDRQAAVRNLGHNATAAEDQRAMADALHFLKVG